MVVVMVYATNRMSLKRGVQYCAGTLLEASEFGYWRLHWCRGQFLFEWRRPYTV